MNVTPRVSVVFFGALVSTMAYAGPNPAPHAAVIPSDDASHACPALQAKHDRAKSAAEATLFENQLWAHGCFSCDDGWRKVEELATWSDDIYAAKSVEETEKFAAEQKLREYDSLVAYSYGKSDTVQEYESYEGYAVLYPRSESAISVFAGLAKYCQEEAELHVDGAVFNALSCHQTIGVKSSTDCYAVEAEVLKGFEIYPY